MCEKNIYESYEFLKLATIFASNNSQNTFLYEKTDPRFIGCGNCSNS